jgi:hypothetical protein
MPVQNISQPVITSTAYRLFLNIQSQVIFNIELFFDGEPRLSY